MTTKRRYTYFAGCIVVLFSMIGSWLFFSIIAWIVSTNTSYGNILRDSNQLIAVFFLYWWCPGMFILADMYDWDD